MKKLVLASLLALGLVFMGYPIISHAKYEEVEIDYINRPVEVNINGEFIPMDVHPIMENNRLFLPIRSLSSLGFSYSWNPSTKVTTVKNKNGEYLKITSGSNKAYKGNQPIQMDESAQSKDGRVLVPIRFVSETLGYHVQYEAIRKIVFVTSKDYKFDMSTLNQEDLLPARRAAISLPITTDFKTLGVSGTYHFYRFPIGRADTYILNDGRFETYVQIQDGKAIAIGQRDTFEPSRAAGNVPPNMIWDTDTITQPFQRGVLFKENGDGTATAAYGDDEKKDIKTKVNVYSDIIQALPNHL